MLDTRIDFIKVAREKGERSSHPHGANFDGPAIFSAFGNGGAARDGSFGLCNRTATTCQERGMRKS